MKKILIILLNLLLLSGCLSIELPDLEKFSSNTPLSAEKVSNFIKVGPQRRTVLSPTLVPERAVRMPRVGETNPYGIKITAELELAYNTYLGGDGLAGLQALESAERQTNEVGTLWQISFLRTQILLMLGRSENAESEIIQMQKYEQTYNGHTLNSLALRSEIQLWRGDHAQAIQDAAGVLHAIGDWKFPTFYATPPNNLTALYSVTTAQLRAMTVLGGALYFEKKYDLAYRWLEAAEQLYNDVHYVSDHPVYGIVSTTHADSYYGRAVNLAFLASTELNLTKNIAAANIHYKRGRQFFQKLGYIQGEVIVEAFRAEALFRSGQVIQGDLAAKKALDLARRYGFPDFIWRIQGLRGKMLFRQKRFKEAESAFRSAQASLDHISGALQGDHAKTRFGIGKEDISQYLIKLDLRKKDYFNLFGDLERGRARAFVSTLANRKIEESREQGTAQAIRKFENDIIQLRLNRFAPDAFDPELIKHEEILLKKRDQLLMKLRETDPELAEVFAVSVSSLVDIQKRLGAKETLVYALPVKRNSLLKLLLINQKTTKLKTLSITMNELQEGLDNFADSIGFEDEENETVQVLTSGLQPQSWVKGRIVYFVPADVLHFVPWGVFDLQTPLVVLPTGGWLLRRPKQIVSETPIIIVGDPEFGGDLVSLPGARKEAKSLSELYKVTPLLGKQATEHTLRKKLGRGVRVLHLATHAQYSAKDPLKSAIFLSQQGHSKALSAQMIFENPLPAQFVVLSGCETGMGKIVSGEDLLGLNRSFYLGGTLAILASMWTIEDEGTRDFMEIFHQESTDGNLAKAWLAARNSLKSKGYVPSVYGAFVLGGTEQL